MKDRLYNLMCEADLESGCVYGDCDLKFIADHLIDSGLVIALPCKVGDTVWCIDLKKIHPYELTDVTVRKKEMVFFSVMNGFMKVIEPEDIGKTVFLTKKEAEAKLAELKGE